MDSRGNVFMDPEAATAILRAHDPDPIDNSPPSKRRGPRVRPMASAGPGAIPVSPDVMAVLRTLPGHARRVFYGVRRRDPENIALAKAKAAATNGRRSRK